MTEAVSPETLARLDALLAAGAASGKPAPPPSYGGHHEAAAVRGCFDPDHLWPVPGAPAEDTLDELLAHCEPASDANGARRRALAPAIRLPVLRQLRRDDRVGRALEGALFDADPVGRMLASYLTGTARPIGEQNLAEVLASHQACEWLRAAGFEGVPEEAELARRTDWLTLLIPFEHLAGTHFRGRSDELQRLRSYVGVLPPGSVLESTRRFAERVLSLQEKAPLLVRGPGGVGKSTLISRFILEHARALEEDRFPFAYLDLDRPDVDASEPVTLLAEAVRQLGIEYPHVRESSEHIRQGWLDRLAKGESPRRVRSTAVRDFTTLIESLGAADRPVLLVLDTFEKVQWRSDEQVAAIWRLLEELQPAVPRLRVVVAGRGELPGYKTQDLLLDVFDQKAAAGYLEAAGVSDFATAMRLAREFGGSPLTLKLLADLVQREGGAEALSAPRSFLFLRARGGTIQRQLYHRILDHIHEPAVRKLAHPGLVLRRVTPELIRDVLAEPCGLSVRTLAEAETLFEKLRREVSLVSVAPDGSLAHRDELRRLMLGLLESDEPQKARWIRELAVAYYEPRAPHPQERAEELYHRLALGHPSDVLDERWITGVEPYLQSAMAEFSGAPRAYLASRLGLVVDDQTRRQADLEAWERIVERQVSELLADERTEDALEVMAARSDRSRRSPLPALEADALTRLERFDEGLDVLEAAIGRALADGERGQTTSLALQQAELLLLASRPDRAAAPAARLEALASHATRLAERLNLLAHRLALGRALAPLGPPRDQELALALRDVFDRLTDERLARDSGLARWAAWSFGEEDPHRFSRVLHLAGFPRADEPAVRELAAAIAAFDRMRSEQAREEPGMIARALGVPVLDSLTSSWGAFLLGGRELSVTDALRILLGRRWNSLPGAVLEALATVLRPPLGAQRRAAAEAPMDRPARPRGKRSLPGPVRRQVHAALLAVFPTREKLRAFLLYRLETSVDAIAPATTAYEDVVDQIVGWATETGTLLDLVAGAREAYPADPQLAAAARELSISTIVPGDPAALEGIVRTPRSIDLGSWRQRLAAIEGQVCRVEVGATALATGFLVGPDLMLTADYVLSPVHEGAVPLEDVHLRFDYKTAGSGSTVTPGTVFNAGELLARSEFAARPGFAGYVLVRVLGSPGAQPIGGERAETSGALRQWIEVPDPAPALIPGDGLTMVQHPRGAPLRFAMAGKGVVGLSVDGLRVYHALETEPGSGGSPCFTTDLELVAFHIGKWGVDPGAPGGSSVAVLMSAVLEDLERTGQEGLLRTRFA